MGKKEEIDPRVKKLVRDWIGSKTPEEKEQMARSIVESGSRLLMALRDLQKK